MVKKEKPKMTKEQIAEKKKRKDFSNQIDNIFTLSGFKRIPVSSWQFNLGGRSNELDHCFIYENILVICEDTIRFVQKEEKNVNSNIDKNRHKAEKEETARIIMENHKEDFINLLKNRFPEEKTFSEYSYKDFRIFYLYFEYGVNRYSNSDIERYNHLIFIDKSTFSYFSLMAKSIKHSFKHELFKFLKLKRKDIGKPDPSGNLNTKVMNTAIIYPSGVTGYKDNIRMVSFMMKPIDLIENSYVLRKDGWNQETDMYQRLITPKRIKNVREFVANKETMFLNNIIVTLPDSVSFFTRDESGAETQVFLEDIREFKQDIFMRIPLDYNSIGIIDGQHRVFAYYENDIKNIMEEKVEKLRTELNLLVTGIIYPKDGPYKEINARRRFESEIFVSINKNAKPVDPDTLIQVQAIMNPTSGEAISRKVIEALNKKSTFENMFQLSKTDGAPIKTASIIQYALSSLLVAKNNQNSLFKYWINKNRYNSDFVLERDNDIKDYVNYCANALDIYFKAIKSKFINHWNAESKLLKVISLNAFIIAFRETLFHTNGPREYDFYCSAFKDLNIDFGKDNEKFPYAGAQYSKFAKTLIIPAIEKQNRLSL